jgi:hypothetical protein
MNSANHHSLKRLGESDAGNALLADKIGQNT